MICPNYLDTSLVLCDTDPLLPDIFSHKTGTTLISQQNLHLKAKHLQSEMFIPNSWSLLLPEGCFSLLVAILDEVHL